jgi:hypothetical protein
VVEKGNADVAARLSLVGPRIVADWQFPVLARAVYPTHLGDWQYARVLEGLVRLRLSKHAQPFGRCSLAPGKAGVDMYGSQFRGRANDDSALTF